MRHFLIQFRNRGDASPISDVQKKLLERGFSDSGASPDNQSLSVKVKEKQAKRFLRELANFARLYGFDLIVSEVIDGVLYEVQ